MDPPLRGLPSVDRVLRRQEIAALLARHGREPVVRLVRTALEEIRQEVRAGADPSGAEEVARRVVAAAEAQWTRGPIRVLNATGVILHTNLGRAPLSQDAIDSVREAAGYVDLEVELESGARGSRTDHVANLLQVLTGAEAAHVSGNNAGAVMLALTALARGKEVIVSRGQAVEIGGGFRVPNIMRQSGARLVEVGTTNRTRLEDYREAFSNRTAAILHVHSSNFKIIGFTETPSLADLARLAHDRGVLLLDDNGSGSFLPTEQFGLAHEPTPIDSLAAGSDLVSFSGDKLLGGPQAGILLGRADLIARAARHPLARALRPDKLTLAALSATLLSYLRGDAVLDVPVWRMIAESSESLERRAQHWQQQALDRGLPVDLVPGESAIGGGSLPGETLPTTLIKLPARIGANDLRFFDPPVFTRVQGRRVMLDLRTVAPEDDAALLDAVSSVVDSAARRYPAGAGGSSTK